LAGARQEVLLPSAEEPAPLRADDIVDGIRVLPATATDAEPAPYSFAPPPKAPPPPPPEPDAPAIIDSSPSPKSQPSAPVIAGLVVGVLALAFYVKMRNSAAPPAPAPSARATVAASSSTVAATSTVPVAGQVAGASATATMLPAADAPRPAASFEAVPRVVVAGEVGPEDLKPPTPPEDAATKKPRRLPRPSLAGGTDEDESDSGDGAPNDRVVTGPTWTFEGFAFDLLTGRGVFAAQLVFYDASGVEIGETETGTKGHYKLVLPADEGKGYTLKISHPDYTDRYIDERASASGSIREASPELRSVLMKATARNIPWLGSTRKTTRRDFALVPRYQEDN
jgi:hypothetical protein